jgi:hypothetical protein
MHPVEQVSPLLLLLQGQMNRHLLLSPLQAVGVVVLLQTLHLSG